MDDLHSLFNCSVKRDFEADNLLNATSINSDVLKFGAGFNTITGIILVFFINVIVSKQHKRIRYYYTSRNFDKKLLWSMLILILLAIMSPIIVLCLALAFVYKFICFIIIKWEDQNFVKFLDSFDVFWSLEDDATKSIINVLGVMESECAEQLVESIQEKILNVSGAKGRKIFYRRTEKYGFYYWRKPDFIDMKEYIQLVDIPHKCNHLDVSDLEQMLINVSVESLPFNGEGMFQIFITKQTIDRGEEKRKYAVICRIHHSVGDAIALLQFLCQALDAEIKSDTSYLKIVEGDNNCNKSASDLIEMIKKLVEILISFTSLLQRRPDNNSLHEPELIGESLFEWIDEDENIFIMIKAIKDYVKDISFFDVILAALSQSLQNYYLKTMDCVPEHGAVIIPVRHAKAGRSLELEKDISVNLLNLPINGNFEDIGKYNKRLRESADSLCLPNYILEPIMNSKHDGMSFSNVPGPEETSVCGGNRLTSQIFFASNKETTGFRFVLRRSVTTCSECRLSADLRTKRSRLASRRHGRGDQTAALTVYHVKNWKTELCTGYSAQNIEIVNKELLIKHNGV